MLERRQPAPVSRVFYTPSGLIEIHEADCLEWLSEQPDNSFEAVVTDPPYGMLEYTPTEIEKMRKGRAGVWRIPPSIGGHKRAPVPRFTVLDDGHKADLYAFFEEEGAER